MEIYKDLKKSFQKGSVVTKMIYINLAFYLIIVLYGAIASLSVGPVYENYIESYLELPSSLSILLFRPWTLFTYMFAHSTKDIFHVLSNILWLYFMGRIFIEYLGGRRLLSVYFVGGVIGGILFVLSYNLLPALHTGGSLIGASAAVLAVVWGICMYMPNYTVPVPFLGGVKLKYFAWIGLFLDLVSIANFENVGGMLAHIGGAMYGLYFASRMAKGKDVTKGPAKIGDWIVAWFKPKSKLKVSYYEEQKDVASTYSRKKPKVKPEVVDRILDKIKKTGYRSLTKEEKEILFKVSNEK